MKCCLVCHKNFQSVDWRCHFCGTKPNTVANFISFVDDKREQDFSFPINEYQTLAELEAKNFWFRARNRLIIWVMKKYFGCAKNFLEIGCGTGFVAAGIHKQLPHLKISASDLYTNGLSYAANRLPTSAELFQLDARAIPFVDEFDVVGCFDVLEHIEQDELVLRQIYKAIHPGGGVILTVPQHQFLWSQQDVFAYHQRRYSAKDLKQKIKQAGFSIIKCTSFMSLLFPILWVSRLLKSVKQTDPMDEFRLPALINFSFEKILLLERQSLKLGLHYPFGGSLLLVAKKLG